MDPYDWENQTNRALIHAKEIQTKILVSQRGFQQTYLVHIQLVVVFNQTCS